MDRKLGNLEQLCYVREYKLASGRAEGETVLECYNGKFHFSILPSRGMDIYSLDHAGSNISFISKNGLTKPYHGGEFVNFFPGGFLYACGLDSIGAPQNGFTQHGSFHYIPADNFSYKSDGNGIEIKGTVSHTALFGSHLRLSRTVRTDVNSDLIEISDEIINCGYKDDKYVLLYHFNIGYPMLSPETKIDFKHKSAWGINEFSQEGLQDSFVMEAPQDNGKERVFGFETINGKIKITNPVLNKTLEFSYDNAALPYLTEWKSMVSGDYALGIEPATSKLHDLCYRTIKPQEKAVFAISLRVTDFR